MSKETITRGTSNVFADFGLPESTECQTKTKLAHAINELLKSRKLKQREAVVLLGMPRPKVSSIERLVEMLTALDRDVE